MEGIERIFAEIYDPEQDFHPTDNRDNCKYCPYKHLCGMS
ncbi:MAG: PD-(D/E)XK nuclease family protein [Prevotella sp.]|nr:PD-(D/E)XK nuclease family protein [Prevotella sp.]